MLTLTLFTLAALAGEIEIEADVPVEIVLDGAVAAKVYAPARLTLREISPGEHTMVIFRAGTPNELKVEVPQGGRARVLIGAGALEVQLPEGAAPEPDVLTTAHIELRLADGLTGARVTLGDQRLRLSAQSPVILPTLPAGDYRVEIRSADATSIWARGSLRVTGGDELLIVLSEGRVPEVFGSDGAWQPDR